MNIFNTIYKGEYKNTLRSLRFNLLQKLAGPNAEKFECFRPVISGLPTQEHEQERKAEFVQLFTDMINAGVNFDSLPTGCGCEDLVGNVCTIAGTGYAELVAGITAAAKQKLVTVCASNFTGDPAVTMTVEIPDGATFIGAYSNEDGNPLNDAVERVEFYRIDVDGTTVTFHIDSEVNTGTASICYTYAINE